MWRFAATLRKGGGEGPNLHLLHSTMSESPYLQTELPSTFVAHVGSHARLHTYAADLGIYPLSHGWLHAVCRTNHFHSSGRSRDDLGFDTQSFVSRLPANV